MPRCDDYVQYIKRVRESGNDGDLSLIAERFFDRVSRRSLQLTKSTKNNYCITLEFWDGNKICEVTRTSDNRLRIDNSLLSIADLAEMFCAPVAYIDGYMDAVEELDELTAMRSALEQADKDHKSRVKKFKEDSARAFVENGLAKKIRDEVHAEYRNEIEQLRSALFNATAKTAHGFNPPSCIADLSGLRRLPALFGEDMTGVYFLCHKGSVVYVGQSVHVAGRLAGHSDKTFDDVYFITCDVRKLDAVERYWINTLLPSLNKDGITKAMRMRQGAS